MYMYEMILDILKKNGPTSIPSICQEMNEQTIQHDDQEKVVQPQQVKKAISRKKDLFKVEDNVVFIDPEKDVQLLTVHLGGLIEPALTIKVDFIKNTFAFFQWHLDLVPRINHHSLQQVRFCGDVESFKKELYRLRLWEWDTDYHPDEMVLDGLFWSVKLVTKSKVYESEGLQCFPKEWKKLCRALSKLTGFDLP